MKLTVFVLFILCSFLQPKVAFTQLQTYQFEQIDSLQKIEKRTVVVFIHTDWCKYCQAMKNTTFSNKLIIEKLNKDFFFINFNAEEKRRITFNNQTFNYNPTGNNTGDHKLATQLALINGKVAYPTLCFLNSKNEIIFQSTDFKSKKEFERMLAILK